MGATRLGASWVLALVLACGGGMPAAKSPPSTATPAQGQGDGGTALSAPVLAADARLAGPAGMVVAAPSGLQFDLRPGPSQHSAPAQVRNVAGTPVPDAQADRLLAALPALPADTAIDASFAKRPPSQPPPTAVNNTQAPFPPAATQTPPVAAKQALELLRLEPHGEVALAPEILVTFNQPMVALSSHASSVAARVPVTLVPQPPGKWRWMGTRTLAFTPDGGRMPMATEYRIQVAQGVRSADGSALAKAVDERLFTPVPRIVHRTLRTLQPTSLQPVLAVQFDQRIERTALIAQARFCWSEQSCVAARAATEAEIAADEPARGLLATAASQGLDARVVALVPEQALPLATKVRARLGRVPSAEGPRLGAATELSFATYGPLRVASWSCGYDRTCAPGDHWRIQLTNPVVAESIDLRAFKVEPAAELKSVFVHGYEIQLEVASRARTGYRVTLPPGLRDVFGQTLTPPLEVSFQVGDPRPSIGDIGAVTVLDPAGARALQLTAEGIAELRVRVRRVTPQLFDAFLAARERDPFHEVKLPGTGGGDRTLKIADPLVRATHALDLSGELPKGLGHAVVLAQPARWSGQAWSRPWLLTWVQSTQLALDVFHDREHVYAWVTRLADGTPVAGASVAIEPDAGVPAVKTDAHGLAKLPLPAQAGRATRLLTARVGDDVTFYPERMWGPNAPSGWTRGKAREALRWFVFDDRGAYRPGETAHVKGWLRATRGGPGGSLVVARAEHVSYRLTSSRGHEIARGQTKLGTEGSFDLALALPSEVDLGQAYLQLSVGKGADDAQHGRALLIEEFRRPEYEVALEAGAATHFVGTPVRLQTRARYYTGGPLAGAATHYEVSATRAQFAPPHRSDYAFGEPLPWEGFLGRSSAPYQEPVVKRWDSLTDARGEVVLDVLPSRAEPAYPHTLQATVSVQDVNRQRWSDQAQVLVHPADTYVGLKLERRFIAEGETMAVDAIAVDLDGKHVAGRKVELRGVRREAYVERGLELVRELDEQTCAFTSDGGPKRCTFRPAEAGSYELFARVYDAAGRLNETHVTFWVAGAKRASPSALEGDAVELVPDKREYAPGDVAQVLVLAPFAPAEAVVLIERDGVRSREQLRIAGGSHTLRIPIEAGHAPNVHVQVALAGQRPAFAGRSGMRPAFGIGLADLPVSLAGKRLGIEVKPQAAELEPGASTAIDVLVRGPDGQPVAGAEVAVVVVDEAVLALTGYTPGDPIETFFPRVEAGVEALNTRVFVRLREPSASALPQGAGGGAGILRDRVIKTSGGGADTAESATAGSDDLLLEHRPVAQGERHSSKAKGGLAQVSPGPALRAEFSPIALFVPQLRTAADGRAQTRLELPDDLTRYRIFALASAGAERFGRAESTVTARKLLMVRPSAPRFLNFGDRFELPIVVENTSGEAQSVLVAARAANAVFTHGRGRRVQVPARDRVELRLPMATRAAGRARVQIAVQGKHGSDAAQVELPVWTPATSEAFATYGSLADEGALAQPLSVPTDVWREHGGLEISTSSTQIAVLTDALLYVDAYPYDCSEQVASRIITLLALRDVLAAFGAADVPSADEARASVRRGVRQLLDMQNGDGGFPYWERGHPSQAYNTLHALHALIRAQTAGVQGIEPEIRRARYAAPRLIARDKLPREAQRTELAYLAYLDMLAGRSPEALAAVEKLWREVKPGEHGVEATGFMLSAVSRSKSPLARAMLAALQTRASETASTAQFNERYSDGAHVLLHSEQRSDAIALEGMMRSAPDHDLAPKLAKGLLAQRKRGRWRNTQENVFAALALRAYFDHYERETPSFEARTFLGSILAQSARFEGRSTEQVSTTVPMAFLQRQPQGSLLVQKLGKGRMYYRLGLHYAPKSLALAPENQGFEVERSYEAIDDPADVSRDRAGVWHVKAGARVRVNVLMIAKARRYHVALVDPVPAGFEPVQPGLLVNAGAAAGDDGSEPEPCPSCLGGRSRGRWWGPWYEHDNMRDERAEAFSSLLPAGAYSYRYTARATTPGEFVVPPAKAEEMYMPETFGRSASDRVVVK